MNIHEYQAKALLTELGVPIPRGRLVNTPKEASVAFSIMGLKNGVIKAQIHSGGRGKAGGVIHVASPRECEEAARKLLGNRLVTSQSGPHGLPVDRVLVEESLEIQHELYLSISLDRSAGRPVAVASASGGMNIESGETQLLREVGNLHSGLEPFQGRKIAVALGMAHEQIEKVAHIVLALGDFFMKKDCTLIELNPLAVLRYGRLVAADAKMSFDDNALFRHPEIAKLRDQSQEDPREVEADQNNLSYVGLDGNIGCMVNGAGLAMATLDMIRLCGGEPANFLDVGGNTTAERVAAAFNLLRHDAHVRAILVNIFGGIVRCDLIAEGIVQAAKQSQPKAPLVVRLEGTKAAEGRAILAQSGLRIIPAESLEESARKAVEVARS